MERWRRAAKAAFPCTLPVLTGYLFLGLAYGILMREAGWPVWLTALSSAAVYAGSLQFAAVPMLAAADPLGTFVLALAVNARHVFYALSMLGRYRACGRFAPYLVFGLTDETFSVNVAARIPAGADAARFYTCTTAMDHLYWTAAGALGAALGGLVPFDTSGVEFVMTALFTAICTEQWLSSREHRPALAGFAVTGACLALFGPSSFLLPAMAALVAVLLALRGPLERAAKGGNGA